MQTWKKKLVVSQLALACTLAIASQANAKDISGTTYNTFEYDNTVTTPWYYGCADWDYAGDSHDGDIYPAINKSTVMIKHCQKYNVVAKTPCTGFYLSTDTTRQLIQQNALWKEAFSWLSWINYLLAKRDMQLVGNNSYHQIRAMLLNMAEWDETLRSKIGVMNHIQQSTRISRSVVAEVLAALRQGNYINMSRGKLVSINRLPMEY